MTVKDLLEEKTSSYGYKEPLVISRVIAVSSKTGYQIFDTLKNRKEYVLRFYDREIVNIYADLTCEHDFCYSPRLALCIKITILE